MNTNPAAGHMRSVAAAVLTALAFGAALAPVHAQEAAVLKRATELREAPGDGSRVLTTLPAESALTRTGERQGPWVRVRSAEGTTGWIHLFDIGTPARTSTAGSLFGGTLRSVTTLFAKPTTQRANTPTSTIGIRGLGAEDIARAQPDELAVTKMHALRASDSDARQFAREARLVAVQVDPLPAPAPASVAPSAPSAQPQSLAGPENL